jgi:hypothetical protein
MALLLLMLLLMLLLVWAASGVAGAAVYIRCTGMNRSTVIVDSFL